MSVTILRLARMFGLAPAARASLAGQKTRRGVTPLGHPPSQCAETGNDGYLQPGNRKLAILVDHDAELTTWNSPVNQNVQSSTGSTVIAE